MPEFSVVELNDALPKKWTVESELGSGGQGSVFRGFIEGTPSAIKVFHDNDDADRISRELEAAVHLTSPHICKILGRCQVVVGGSRVTAIAYELCGGGDLSARIGATPSLSELASIGRDMCMAISDLWENHIVHRDIKPANIVSDENGRYVLIDLGFARHLDKSSLTVTGATFGTRGYLSPEQRMAWKNLTAASDVFNLGVTLFELACGDLPEDSTIFDGSVGAVLLGRRADLVGFSDLVGEMLIVKPYERTFPEDLTPRFAALI